MPLDNFQAQVANLYDTREIDSSDPLGYRDRNAADSNTTISVFEAGTTNAVTTYPTNDENGTANPHPFNTDNEGNFIFYAEAGIRVDVVVNYVQFSSDNRGWYDVTIGTDLSSINDQIDNINSEITDILEDITGLPTSELVEQRIEDALVDFGGDLRNYQQDLVGQVGEILTRNEGDLNSVRRDRIIRSDIFRLDAEIANALASVTQINQVIVDNEQALAQRLILIDAQFENSNAQILSNQQAIASETQARVTQFNGINSRLNDAESSIIQTETALATETETRATQINQIEVTTNGLTTQITQVNEVVESEGRTRATQVQELRDADTGLVQSIQEVSGANTNNQLAITGLRAEINDENTGLSATFNLATEIDTDLEVYRANAQIAVQANGNAAFIQLGATPTVTRIRFGAGEIEFLNPNGTRAVFFDTVSQRYEFDGTIYARNIEGDVTDGDFGTLSNNFFLTPSTPERIIATVNIEPEPFRRILRFDSFPVAVSGTAGGSQISTEIIGAVSSGYQGVTGNIETIGSTLPVSAIIPPNVGGNAFLRVRRINTTTGIGVQVDTGTAISMTIVSASNNSTLNVF